MGLLLSRTLVTLRLSSLNFDARRESSRALTAGQSTPAQLTVQGFTYLALGLAIPVPLLGRADQIADALMSAIGHKADVLIALTDVCFRG
jgi:hypothetical protein